MDPTPMLTLGLNRGLLASRIGVPFIPLKLLADRISDKMGNGDRHEAFCPKQSAVPPRGSVTLLSALDPH